MGGLCEERSEKGRGGRKVERKGQQQGPMAKITKEAIQWSDKRPTSPLQKENERKNKSLFLVTTNLNHHAKNNVG